MILVHWYLSIQCLCSNVVAANIPCLSPQEGFDIRKMNENRCLSLSCKIDIHWISTYGYKVLTITILLSQTCLFSSYCRNATLLIGHWGTDRRRVRYLSKKYLDCIYPYWWKAEKTQDNSSYSTEEVLSTAGMSVYRVSELHACKSSVIFFQKRCIAFHIMI